MVLGIKEEIWNENTMSVFGWGNLKLRGILNSKNFKYLNWNSFIFKILCLYKKKLKLRVKENESRVRECDFGLLGEKEDEGYKGNTQTFWKVLM